MDIFATIWWPSPNLIGPSSIGAAMVVSILVLVTRRCWSMNRTELDRQDTVRFVTKLLLVLAAVTEGSPVFYVFVHRRSLPDANDFLGGYIYLAFGFGFALHLLRLPGVKNRRTGSVLGFVFGVFIVAEAVMRTIQFPFVFFGGYQLDWTPIVFALGVFTAAWWCLTKWIIPAKNVASEPG
jgi:hypothetical protein